MGSTPDYEVMECKKRTFFMYEKSHKYWPAYSFHCCLLYMLDILSCNWGMNQEMINQYNSSTHSNFYYHSNYKEIFIHCYTQPNKNIPAYLASPCQKLHKISSQI
jgi:hypothetical protein